VEVGTQREENYLGIKNVLKHPNIILGGFLSLATLNIMNTAYSNVLEYIKMELSLNYTQSGALMSAYFVGYAIGQIPWGFMADKFGSRRIMSISVLGVSLSTLLFGFSRNFKIAIITRFLSGLLGAGVFVPSVRLVSGWFKADERGTALGILNIGGSSGLIIASWVTPLISLNYSWSFSMKLFGFIGMLTGGIAWFLLKDNNENVSKGISLNTLPLQEKAFWILALSQFMRLGAYYTYIAWLPLVLKEEYGFSVIATSTAISLFNMAGMFANPIGGIFSDRFGEKPILIGSFSFLGTLMLIITGRLPGAVIYFLVLLIGWFINFIRSPTFMIIPQIFGAKASGSISGIHNTFASIGALILPFTLGFIKDHTHSYNLGWMASSLLMYLVASILLILKTPKRNHNK
jgi:nitrate/nitrite transporter NarK